MIQCPFKIYKCYVQSLLCPALEGTRSTVLYTPLYSIINRFSIPYPINTRHVCSISREHVWDHRKLSPLERFRSVASDLLNAADDLLRLLHVGGANFKHSLLA